MNPTLRPAPIEPGQRRIANIHDSEFTAFIDDEGLATGESYLSLDSSQAAGLGFHIYRMAPGTSSTPHAHTADEHFLVLEGDITDNDGFQYRAGDLVLLEKGTEHFSTSKNGCTLAVFIGTKERSLKPTAATPSS